jgi:hypothetical protein
MWGRAVHEGEGLLYPNCHSEFRCLISKFEPSHP